MAKIPNQGLGKAINDRLMRASSFNEYDSQIIELSKNYNQKAVNNISFKLNKNEIIGILDPMVVEKLRQ